MIALQRQDAWRAAALDVYDRTPVGRLALRQGFVVTGMQARMSGMTERDVRCLVRRGEWTTPRRGTVCVLARPAASHDPRPHGLRPEIAAAAAVLTRRDAVISHECATLAHGADVLHTPRRATLTACGRRFSGARGGAVIRAAWLDEADLTSWFGVPITSCARAVVDLARRGARDGIVAVESALREGLVTQAELNDVIERQRRWDGVITARRVLELADGKSESALESLTRLFLADHRVPLPEQQAWIDTHRGSFRVDGLWRDRRVILEVDGLDKYRGSPDALIAEKLRQEALEQAGYRVVRVTWADIHHEPERTLARIRAALR